MVNNSSSVIRWRIPELTLEIHDPQNTVKQSIKARDAVYYK